MHNERQKDELKVCNGFYDKEPRNLFKNFLMSNNAEKMLEELIGTIANEHFKDELKGSHINFGMEKGALVLTVWDDDGYPMFESDLSAEDFIDNVYLEICDWEKTNNMADIFESWAVRLRELNGDYDEEEHG
jgi:hypothetical protein